MPSLYFFYIKVKNIIDRDKTKTNKKTDKIKTRSKTVDCKKKSLKSRTKKKYIYIPKSNTGIRSKD